MSAIIAAFWRRLDRPGHDSCRLLQLPDGWRLEGMAVFFDQLPCHFRYEVEADPRFQTRHARVSGYQGDRAVDLRIETSAGRRWRLGGRLQKGLEGCLDVDLGFTPATNLLAIRRLDLEVGSRTPAPAAYLEFPALKLVRLEQTYHRLGPSQYAYESPAYGYAGTLEVLPSGFVARYPGLFELIRPP